MPTLIEADARGPIAEQLGGTRHTLARLIAPGWGSNGWYSPDVLRAAAEAGRFPVGLHMYWDHPPTSDDMDRGGVRSLRDLAGVTTSVGRYIENGPVGPGVYAETDTAQAFRAGVTDLADHIGVSIRFFGEVAGSVDREGRSGPEVRSIDEVVSADYVTVPGAGGRIVEMFESARPAPNPDAPEQRTVDEQRNTAHWLEALLHLDFTQRADMMFADGRLTRLERIALSSAIGEALQAFAAAVERDVPDLLERDPWAPVATDGVQAADENAGGDTLTIRLEDGATWTVGTEFVTVTRSDGSTPTGGPSSTLPANTPEGSMPYETIEEASAAADAAIAERDTARTEAEQAAGDRAELRRLRARTVVTEALRAQPVALPAPALARVIDRVVARDDLAVSEDGREPSNIDTLARQIGDEAVAEARYLAGLGVLDTGRFNGVGDHIADEANLGGPNGRTDQIAEGMKSLGLTDEQAALAAGR